jgi:UDP-N-acetylmuramoyl-L-alanyl-D-glutamate--2,6-diaminopimelate ligase
MRLCDLVTDVSYDPRFANLAIAGLAADSRAVKPGFLFVAVAGSKADGLVYVAQAVAAGAVAVMAERRPESLPDHVAFIGVPNARRALALAAAKFYPRQPATIAAVTGTSGKTSVAYFTRQIWERLGHRAAALGTLGVVTSAGTAYGSLTTPDPVTLHATIDRLAGEGVTHLAMEASSHGLDQYRLDGVHVDAAAFTNLSRDHLDYHRDLDAYLRAKLRLFSDLVVPGGAAVVAADHDEAAAVLDVARRRGLRILSVGRNGESIRLLDVSIEQQAQNLTLTYRGRRRDIRLPLVGAFQVENALVAAGLVLATGGDEEAVFGALAHLRGAKGRLELVAQARGAAIFVDYAHKPDALAKALEALRPYAKGRLAVVFGAGGDRDHGKRPVMGAIASERADLVVVTDDNPRSEDPASIRRAILATAPGAIEIGDRGEAIRWAIGEMRSGDILLIAGKGHETGQIVGDRVLPFSDHEAVAAALGDKVA